MKFFLYFWCHFSFNNLLNVLKTDQFGLVFETGVLVFVASYDLIIVCFIGVY